MRFYKNSILFITLSLLLSVNYSNCFKKKLAPDEYRTWIMNNKNLFMKSEMVEEFYYQLIYIPTELKLLNYAKSTKLTKKEVETFVKTNDTYLEFSLRISIPENGSVEFLKYTSENGMSYEDKLKHYSFDLKKNIVLVTEDGKKINCSDYVFERSFDIQPSGTITLSFIKPDKLINFEVIVIDKGFKDLTIKFPFEEKMIKKRPTLKYSTLWSTK